jgi:hypothetical protein
VRRWLPLLALALLAAAPPKDFDPTGTWMLELDIVTDATVPVLGDSAVLSHRTNIATIRRLDGRWLQHHTTCDVTAITERAIAVPIIPDSFVKTLPDKTYVLQIEEVDGQLRYAADLQIEVSGYDGSEPLPIPIDAADPRVFDHDEDGHPGVTVGVRAPLFGEVDVYITQLAHTWLRGVVETADLIEGKADVQLLEQEIIGAENVLFIRKTNLRVNQERSSFTMTRIADGATCADLEDQLRGE